MRPAVAARGQTVRLILACALAAFLAAAIIAIPTTIVLSEAISRGPEQQAQANSLANCEAQANSRPTGNGRTLLQRIALEIVLVDERHAPTAERATALERTNSLLRAESAVPQRLPEGFPTRVSSLAELLPLLKTLPPINCKERLQLSVVQSTPTVREVSAHG